MFRITKVKPNCSKLTNIKLNVKSYRASLRLFSYRLLIFTLDWFVGRFHLLLLASVKQLTTTFSYQQTLTRGYIQIFFSQALCFLKKLLFILAMHSSTLYHPDYVLLHEEMYISRLQDEGKHNSILLLRRVKEFL